MQFLKVTETKIELQENQRSDQIIDALVHEVIFPPALADAWVLGDPDYSKLGESTKLANLEAFRDYEERRRDAKYGGRQLGSPGRLFRPGERTPSMSTAASATSRRPSGASWSGARVWRIRDRIGGMRRFVTGPVSSHCFSNLQSHETI